MKGLKEVLRTYHAARQQLNPELRILGLLPTFVNLRTRFSRRCSRASGRSRACTSSIP